MFAVAAMVVAAFAPCQPGPAAQPVRITVVTVLATDQNKTVDGRLTELAKAVQAGDKKLTGFKFHASEAKSVSPGDKTTFGLINGHTLEVKVQRARDENDRVSLAIRPPGLGEVTYTCTCERFFPVVTPYRTREGGETIIVAVMARPCVMKK
jgi:hypothetical protein